MEDSNLNETLNLAREKQSLIEEFLQQTEEQATAIKNNHYDSILKTINSKQSIIEQVNLLDLQLRSLRAADNGTVKIITENTRELMARAIAIDDQNIAILKNNQAKIFEKLKNAQKNKTTHDIYRGKNKNMEGILLDKRK